MDKAIVTTSWDDGHPLDLKLAELLNKYDVPATFYIPIDNIERECMNSQQIREIARSFDIGGHTYHHLVLTRVSLKEAEREIVEGKQRLEDIIGKEVLSFCYPRGKFNDEVIKIVKSAGFVGARTTQSLSRSIKESFRISSTVNAVDWWFAPYIKHSLQSRDPELFFFLLKNNLFFKSWDKIAIETLDFIVQHGGVWHLWGHSWEIDNHCDWMRLEVVLRNIKVVSRKARLVDNSQQLKICAERKRKEI